MRHDMESCDQSGEDQDKAWLDGPVAMEKGKSRLRSEGPQVGEAWARFFYILCLCSCSLVISQLMQLANHLLACVARSRDPSVTKLACVA